jgi:hypothetical protein
MLHFGIKQQSFTHFTKNMFTKIVCIVFLLKFKWEMHVSIFQNEAFVSFIMVRTSYIQWNHHVCFFLDKHAYVIESLKCKLTETTVYVGPCKHIILLPSQSVFTRALTPYWIMSRQVENKIVLVFGLTRLMLDQTDAWTHMYIGVSRRETSSFEERGTLKGMYCNLVYCILFQYKC